MTNFKKFKLTCKSCKTQIIADMDKIILFCPACQLRFYDNYEEQEFTRLNEALKAIRANKAFDFTLLCEDKEQQ